mgnify:FL=1
MSAVTGTEAPAGVSVGQPTGPEVPLVSDGYRRYALVMLLIVYTINFLDRQIVSILAEPIKNDLQISDTQLGLLTGLAFGVVYCGFGIPIARLADRFNRVWIIGISLVVWSTFTVLCGRAWNYASLVVFRMGVGVGEAGCTPTSHSLISDYVPKEKRASALAFFSMGTPLGSLLGLAMGGIIADAYGWRTAFLLAGAPGLILAVVIFLTLKEPRNAMSEAARKAAASSRLGFNATLKYLARKRTFWCVAFGGSVKAFIGYGHAPFTASFFLRVHGDEVSRLADVFGLNALGFLGIVLGLLTGVFASISSWAGGAIADKFGGRDLRAYGSVPAIASLAAVPFYIAAMLSPSALFALLLLIPVNLLGSLWYGPVYASAQGLVPPQMRATSGVEVADLAPAGALTVGAFSDFYNYGLGLGAGDGVRWALISTALFNVIAAALFWMARRRIREEMVS